MGQDRSFGKSRVDKENSVMALGGKSSTHFFRSRNHASISPVKTGTQRTKCHGFSTAKSKTSQYRQKSSKDFEASPAKKKPNPPHRFKSILKRNDQSSSITSFHTARSSMAQSHLRDKEVSFDHGNSQETSAGDTPRQFARKCCQVDRRSYVNTSRSKSPR